MSREESPQLNKTYLTYRNNPTSDNYEALGAGLLSFVKATIANQFSRYFTSLEDAVGEACLEIIKDLPGYDLTKGSFTNWVYGVTCHTCLDMLRKEKGRMEEDIEEGNKIISNFGVEDKLIVRSLMGKLSPHEKRIVEMKMYGLSNEEIAQEIGTTEGYVKIKWNRILERLRTLGVDYE